MRYFHQILRDPESYAEEEAEKKEEPELGAMWTVSSGHHRSHAHMNSKTGTTHKPAKVQFQQDSTTEKDKWAQDPTHNQAAIYNLIPIGKEHITTFRARPHDQE